MSLSLLFSSGQHIMYKYEGCASYLYRHLPSRSSEHWWITMCSLFTRMRAIFSKPKPQGEQNPARLCYAVTLRHGAQVCTWPKNECIPTAIFSIWLHGMHTDYSSYTFYTNRQCMHALKTLWLCIKHRFCYVLRSCSIRNYEHLDNAQ
jgi:hypothetical protein